MLAQSRVMSDVKLFRVTSLPSVSSFVSLSPCSRLDYRAASPTFASYGALLVRLAIFYSPDEKCLQRGTDRAFK
jgi:hypothetical protein